MPRSKILHIITGLNTGGAERALYNLLYGGLAERFDCYVISLTDEGTYGPKIRELGVPVIAIGMKRAVPAPTALYKLFRAVKDISPDIIEGWMYHGNLSAVIANTRNLKQSILVWNIRQSLYDLSYEKWTTQQVIRLNRAFSKIPEVILYNSRVSRNQHERFGFCLEKSKVIPNGIDTDKFKPSKRIRWVMREQLEIPQDAFVIGMIARFHPMKDHALFLKSAVDIAQRYKQVSFVLCGKDVDWNNREIVSLIPEHLRARFRLLGERSDVENIFCTLDILSSSSYGEGFSNVVAEAMACGVPCVVTGVGDSAFIIGNAGFIVSSHKERALSLGLEKALLISPRVRLFMQRMAKQRITKYFSLRRMVKQHEEIYDRVL